jgi:hypothetical protein
MPSQPDREAGDIILGWLTRIVVGIAIAGVVAFDGVSIGVAHISTIDDANTAARAASRSWYQDHDIAKALQAAQDVAAEHAETVVANSLRIDPDGTAHLELEHDATTLVVRHVSALHSWAAVKADGSGRYVGA